MTAFCPTCGTAVDISGPGFLTCPRCTTSFAAPTPVATPSRPTASPVGSTPVGGSLVARDAQPPRVNGWAVGSLVLSLTCLAPFAAVFALVALSQIAQSGGRMTGRRLALTALALVALQFVAVIALVVRAFMG